MRIGSSYWHIAAASILFLTIFAFRESRAGDFSADLRMGYSYFGKINDHHFNYAGYSVGSDIVFKQISAVPTHPGFGLGIGYQVPQVIEYKNVGFITACGLMGITLNTQKDNSITKLVLKTGYNWYRAEDNDTRSVASFKDVQKGGMYYDIGIDVTQRNIVAGLHVSENNFTFKRTYRSEYYPTITARQRYRKVYLIVGYKLF